MYRSFGGAGKDLGWGIEAELAQAGVKVRVYRNDANVFVVHTRSAQAFFIEAKAQRLNQVQFATRVGAQAHDIACVRGDFGLE